MDTVELVHQRKRSEDRTADAPAHPAGEIRLLTAGGLGRRAGLLSASPWESDCPWTTVSITLMATEEAA
ncbi:hypothetical protein [Kitasatospora camelliae]|uniref:Uncharacterized protein n=1 Tax=Kitasatospora camelliae TaxID=3156397 RepID=A0AAU8K0B4_9ACTN